MQFDPQNKVVQLCAEGMDAEGRGATTEASGLFCEAWHIAAGNLEKFIAAHYVARHQLTTAKKLEWDELALNHALNIEGDEIKSALPSLYLNIAKCHEDLNNPEQAIIHYQAALSFTHFLPDDGYGNMIRRGISTGLERTGTENRPDEKP